MSLALTVCLASTAALAADNTAVDAARLYQEYCSVCHGDAGDGRSRARQGLTPSPQDFTASEVIQSLTRERMIDAVLNGRPGTAMAGWRTRLSTAQAEAVVDYIRTTFMGLRGTDEGDPGARLYAENCSVCHGDGGAGSVWASEALNPAPRDFSQQFLPRERMIAAVRDGRPGSAMPGFSSQLNDQQIASVVDYIQSAFMPAAPSTPAGLPQGMEGDPAAGKRLYAQNCTSCHGVEGDGEGPRAYFISPKPRNFRDAAAQQLDRNALFWAIKHGVAGRVMPAWGKVLDDQAIADVTEYVYTAFIRDEGAPDPR